MGRADVDAGVSCGLKPQRRRAPKEERQEHKVFGAVEVEDAVLRLVDPKLGAEGVEVWADEEKVYEVLRRAPA